MYYKKRFILFYSHKIKVWIFSSGSMIIFVLVYQCCFSSDGGYGTSTRGGGDDRSDGGYGTSTRGGGCLDVQMRCWLERVLWQQVLMQPSLLLSQ
jgi:hypothetical protein